MYFVVWHASCGHTCDCKYTVCDNMIDMWHGTVVCTVVGGLTGITVVTHLTNWSAIRNIGSQNERVDIVHSSDL